jgi:hypothetical protein
MTPFGAGFLDRIKYDLLFHNTVTMNINKLQVGRSKPTSPINNNILLIFMGQFILMWKDQARYVY